MLIQAGCEISSFASADGKGAPSMDSLYRAAYHDTDTNQVINKMHPDFLKLSETILKCKFKIAATAANNAINKDGEKRV